MRVASNGDDPETAALAGGMWWTFPAAPVHVRPAGVWLAGWLDAQCPGPIAVHARLDGRVLR